ncbi:MAG: Rpn family recombination-promoting nuclease/putative transposase [Candidatus Aminicenantes bacterium]|nr:Rpn family recombination-promoting nuclease/putative transposase [Candidatus Aminicenantes bacterium]
MDNARALLKKVLPEKIKKGIDFSSIKIEDTDYVSKQFEEYYSDIVVKAKMKSKDGGKIPTDICFIVEHKTEGRKRIFIQVLKYMAVRHDGPPPPGDLENFATKTPRHQEFFFNKSLGVPSCLCAFVAIFIDAAGID